MFRDLFRRFCDFLQMGSCFTVIALLAVVHVIADREDALPWDHHVYTGRHLDDYITAPRYGPPAVSTNALLVMYTPKCRAQAEAIHSYKLPPQKFIVLAKHDYETFPPAVWYHLDERDDLVQRYTPDSCMKVMFFRNGSNIYTPEVYDESTGMDVVLWTWEKLKIKFTLLNKRREDILLKFQNLKGDPVAALTVLKVGESRIFYSFPSHSVTILSATSGQPLFRKIVEHDFPSDIVINEEVDIENLQSIALLRQSILDESESIHRFHLQISYYFLLCQNQVKRLPRFTDKGYKKTKIPEQLYTDLKHFYFSRGDLRQNETSNSVAINLKDTVCTLVKLDEMMVKYTAEFLLPIVQEWSNCSLVKTMIFGVREYYKRNILRRHVDRIDTHVISVILQIHKELDGAEDWPLEIVGMDGLVRQIYLEPGDMLLYESTTLIHGRPTPFQGKVYANIFAHFKPPTWEWNIKENMMIHKEQTICSVNKLYTTDRFNTGSAKSGKTEL